MAHQTIYLIQIVMYKYYHQLKQYLRSETYHIKQLQKESAIYEQTRKEVLQHYRFLLKHVPKIYSRKLQQRTAYNEICHLFHDSKVLLSLDQTLSRSQHLRELVSNIKKGDYTVLGSFLPARNGEYIHLSSHFYDMKFRLE